MVAEKLEYLNETKRRIKQAIVDKGVTVNSSDTFRSYADKIKSIQGSGGSGESGGEEMESSDPIEVYNNTRPKDWLPMPSVNENEIYLLFAIYETEFNYFALQVKCTNGYTVDYGNGDTGSYTNGQKAQYIYKWSNFDDSTLTEEGFKQVLIKITGENITEYISMTHDSDINNNTNTIKNILEFKGNLPSLKYYRTLHSGKRYISINLRYFSLEGSNQLGNIYDMFQNCKSLVSVLQLEVDTVHTIYSLFKECKSLKAIPELNVINCTDMDEMFYRCESLVAISRINMSNVTTAISLFEGCTSLRTISHLDTMSLVYMNDMFSGCSSLITIPHLDLSRARIANRVFINCISLRNIPKLDFSNMSNMHNMFDNCISLEAIPDYFDISNGATSGANSMFRGCISLKSVSGINIGNSLAPGIFAACTSLKSLTLSGTTAKSFGIQNTMLTKDALEELFNILPKVTNETLSMTGCLGVPDLTSTIRKIATNKGWTLAE